MSDIKDEFGSDISSFAGDNQSTFDVECILLDRRDAAGNFEYYVKWQGFPSTSNTWEPACNFLCPDMIRDYHEKKREEKRLSDLEKKKIQRRKSVTPNANMLSEDSKAMERLPYIAEKVINICQDEFGNLIVLTKFKGRSKPTFVPSEWANDNYPALVIQFYENRIYWAAPDGSLAKHENNATCQS